MMNEFQQQRKKKTQSRFAWTKLALRINIFLFKLHFKLCANHTCKLLQKAEFFISFFFSILEFFLFGFGGLYKQKNLHELTIIFSLFVIYSNYVKRCRIEQLDKNLLYSSLYLQTPYTQKYQNRENREKKNKKQNDLFYDAAISMVSSGSYLAH